MSLYEVPSVGSLATTLILDHGHLSPEQVFPVLHNKLWNSVQDLLSLFGSDTIGPECLK